jgi:uncharacterized protein (TIGR03435 family)
MRILVLIFAGIASQARMEAQVAPPQFEVASVKAAPPPDGRGMRVSSQGGPGSKDPGLFTCENCQVSGLIMQAYDLKMYQFSGQDWMGDQRFMVSAKVPEGATKEQFRLMLQSLLAERFKLTFHYDKKEMTAYDLLVLKGGPKFKEASAIPSDDDPQFSGPMKKDESGFPILPPGRKSMMAGMGSGYTQRFGEETMEQLAEMLSLRLGGPVADETGLKGKYDFELRWTDDQFTRGESLGLSIAQAIQDQLGLRVQKTKRTVDILVVDHLEKVPTEN